MPAVSFRSLIGSGTPRNGPSDAARANSLQTVTNAFSSGSSRSIRSEVELDELGRGDLAAADEVGLLGGGQEGELVHSLRSSISTAITGPAGGRSAYCGYLAARSSTACGSSTIRAVPRSRTHQRRDQSSS